MNKKLLILVVLFLVILLFTGGYFIYKKANNKKTSENVAGAEYAKGEVIVKFKPEAAKKLEVKPDKPTETGISSINDIDSQLGVKKIERVIKKDVKVKEVPYAPDLSSIYKIEMPENVNINEAVEKYKSNPEVEYAELNYKVEIVNTPNDPYFSSKGTWGQSYDDLWGLKKINASQAWDLETGKSEIIVAVIDTGVDYTHEDLAGNMWINSDDPVDGIDNDHNGYIDDYRGWNFYKYKDTDDVVDDHGHGSHCSGTISAVTNNAKGVAGVSWKTKIMPVKFLNAGGSGYMADAINAIHYAVDNGANILSNSWGGSGRSSALQDAVNYAYNSGVAFVAAAGNSGADVYNFSPGGLNNVISVAATDSNDNTASWSNWGDEIDVAAPGVDILSVRANRTSMGNVVGSKYTRASGTSMACPHVAGLAALVKARKSSLTPSGIEDTIKSNADDKGNPGFDIYFGNGRINAYKTMVGISTVSSSISTMTRSKSQTQVGSYINITVTAKDANNDPVSNVNVVLRSSRGSIDTIVQPSKTDANGVATGRIRSIRMGKSTISAIIDGVQIDKTFSILFYAGPAHHFNLSKITDPTRIGIRTHIRVTAIDVYGNIANGYRGTVKFASSDKRASLPSQYTFTKYDQGRKIFYNSLIFRTVGEQYVKVYDVAKITITGVQYNITVLK